MDETPNPPFPPAPALHLGDEEERMTATRRRIHRRRVTRAGASAAVVVVAAAIAIPLLVPGSSPAKVNVAGGLAPTTTSVEPTPPTTSVGTDLTATTPPPVTRPATSPPPTTVPSTVPTTVPTTVPPTVTTNAGPPTTTTGTVTDSNGRPVAGAYVIGLGNLAVARTDANGDYSIPCASQKLVAGAWLLPVMTTTPGGSGGFTYGVNTTKYGPPPAAAGPGYVFSGGATDVSAASTTGCDATPVDFRLPPGGTVDITWRSQPSPPPGTDVGTTTTVPPTTVPPGLPIDNLYLPGLGQQAALETDPVSSDNHQVVAQLGSGTMRIDGVSTPFTCAGPGVTGSGPIWTVPVQAGQTTSVTCTTT